MRFTADRFDENTISTIGKSQPSRRCKRWFAKNDTSHRAGVDFRIKYTQFHGKKCKLSIWDTAGQERFRTLTSSYYRGAQGIIFGKLHGNVFFLWQQSAEQLFVNEVYDVTRRETFENLEDIWMKEVDMYSTVEDAVSMVIANKVDLVSHFTCVVFRVIVMK
jgi:Ras-related protein Rab-18